ncbi:hypothetical protein BpHYR1_043778 [Brachionus plicatilis]|uniref:Uncharacterized protein n=1 Tax=Brachionus plicatilis TaxID=10195 RepID=A0A3M7RK81_BRAPC|nr:hypothetical protein BpHYR1_043778 [Brachionus plicatilis]
MVNTKVTSIEHLKEVLHKEWLQFPTEYVQILIESMPKRVLACYNAKVELVKSQTLNLSIFCVKVFTKKCDYKYHVQNVIKKLKYHLLTKFVRIGFIAIECGMKIFNLFLLKISSSLSNFQLSKNSPH